MTLLLLLRSPDAPVVDPVVVGELVGRIPPRAHSGAILERAPSGTLAARVSTGTILPRTSTASLHPRAWEGHL